MESKEEKALHYARSAWGIYFDDVDEDCHSSRGENTQQDFLAGYNQAIDDLKILDLLKECNDFLDSVQAPKTSAIFLKEKVSNLIKEIDGDK